jgi:peptide/nickel transport system substrate-binding protein
MTTWLDYELPEESLDDEGGITRADLVRGAVGAAVALPLLGRTGAASASTRGARRRGGRLRIGVIGSGAAETLDPTKAISEVDIARYFQLYEGLTDFDANGRVISRLATQLSPNRNATVWRLRIRQGVTFHDGSELTADDVVYSLQYIVDPATKSTGASSLPFLKKRNIRRIDRNTVELRLDVPMSVLPVVLGERTIRIFKNGTKDFRTPNGTGPFRFRSWTRGERSLFVRNPNYHQSGSPHVDEIEIISIVDPTARLNALLAGQIDALAQLDLKQVPLVRRRRNLRILEKGSGAYTAQYMEVNRPPFTDKRVRQALRLLVNRRQIIQQALGGHGRVGNDLPSWFDEDYARQLPQRPYDPERARSLLRAAGQDGLTLTLHTSDAAPAMLDSSTLIAEQAKRAGVTIRLKKYPSDQYWSGPYLKQPFASTNWGGRPLVPQHQLAYLRSGVYNETEWKRRDYDRLMAQALATPQQKRRHELLVDAQRLLWEEGGTIIWGFLNNLDVVSSRVSGIPPSVLRPLGYWNFRRASVAA